MRKVLLVGGPSSGKRVNLTTSANKILIPVLMETGYGAYTYEVFRVVTDEQETFEVGVSAEQKDEALRRNNWREVKLTEKQIAAIMGLRR